MSTRTVEKESIIQTALGAVKVTLTTISGYDVDDVVSQRTRDEGTRRGFQLIGSELSVDNNDDTVFTSDYIEEDQ